MTEIDKRTGRPYGDHGTALQAIQYAVDYQRFEADTFLKHWLEGDLDEWPEFYEWLTKQPANADLSTDAEPVGWFNPWNDYHGYQQVAKEFEGKPGTIPLYKAPVSETFPEGWQLVPKEPTLEMEAAYRKAHAAKCVDISSNYPTEHPDDGGGPFGYGYRAMLAAAPATKQGEVE